MRRARRPVRRRQELDPEDALRQLCRRRRPDHRQARRRPDRSRHRQPAHRACRPPATRSAMSASSCAPCRASRRSMSSPSRWSSAARSARPRATRRATCWRSSTCRKNSGRCRRRPSPAASSSASTSRAASSPSIRSCCSTSRPPRSTPANRDVVIELIAAKKAAGVALLGIFHDHDVREAVADRIIDVTAFAPGKIAA